MGGRWHGRVQEWVSLDEGQDIIREISGRGEQCSHTYSCTGSGPGGHIGRGSLRTGSWWLQSLAKPQQPALGPGGLLFHLHTDIHTTASLPCCQPMTAPSPGLGHLALSSELIWGADTACFCLHQSPPSLVPGGGDPVLRHRGPGPIQTPLLLELALKPTLDIIQVEGADRRARNAEGARERCGLGVRRDSRAPPR